MKYTVLCLLNSKGLVEYEFSSRQDAVEFRNKNVRKYQFIFIYEETL